MTKLVSIITLSILLLSCQKNIQQQDDMVTTPSGLQYKILKEGTGEEAKTGQDVKIHESTSYRDGTVIFSSAGMDPIQFTLGGKMVIQGVDEGVRGMKKGEIRKLIVPTSLSKRSSYPPILSKDSILVYRIELIDIIH
ncbi:FKBP-type peptidyl-prolyl cis-trans isomerase [uncultured Dokdonia sp.]|uniref:FKBP-type peptidyl-prolyl cis-trans isomerase n=1 Tax=uncultured Dokdonia sp. TaxID=575653 RepID=UPI0026287666|nr:FKBP-type peptidyl-prolyl cis-trans isomerase [uncultured Dokdonia sp.]